MLRTTIDMKNLLVFLWLTLTLDLYSQSVELPPDSLINKFHVRTITTYFNDDTTKNELSNVWQFDYNGKIISNQLFDTEDTSLTIELYFYKADLLTEYWSIGTWLKYDTVKTTYLYDKQNRIIKETTKGKFNPFDTKANGFSNSITYTHLNDSTTIKKYDGSARTYRGSGVDSLIYNKDKALKYLFNVSIDLEISYTYNDQKQLLSETTTSISAPYLTYHYNKYSYEKGRLIKEIIGHSINGEEEKKSEQIYNYINDNNGLLKEIKRPLTYDTYKYEYYK